MLSKRCLGVLAIAASACGSSSGGHAGATGQSSSGGDASTASGSSGGVTGSSSDGIMASGEGGGPGSSTASSIAMDLRGKSHFLVGMGNDLASDHDMDGAYTLGTTLDLHYAYLTGLQGIMGGWPDWNANGGFVDIMCSAADSHGVTPMFTLYSMAAQGEGNSAVLTQDSHMGPYWAGASCFSSALAPSASRRSLTSSPIGGASSCKARPTERRRCT